MMEKTNSGKLDFAASRYMKYALGEILLVVTGILLALQINNWNEDRKLRKDELKLLIDLKSNLENTLENFRRDTQFNYFTIVQFEKILIYVNDDLPYSEELDTSFAILSNWASPYPILTAYKTLQVKGLDIIINEDLRNEIVNLYEYEYPRLGIDYDKTEWDFAQTVTNPFYSKNVRRYRNNSGRRAQPNDFEGLKKNDEFINILEMIIHHRVNGLIRYRFVMKSVQELIESINTEIKSRK